MWIAIAEANMSCSGGETAVTFAPRISDDIYHRIQVLAESRATRNGLDAPTAGRKAVALVKLLKGTDPDSC